MINGYLLKVSMQASYGLIISFLLLPRSAAAADDPITHSLYWAVLFLMAMPYTIVGSIVAWIAYSCWRGNKRRDQLRKQNSYLRLIETPKEGGR